ncbi:WYL domain-containing protein [Kribbella sp. NPDC051718]|uniref:helix-turn-helix transcriptional regulator n=1 Tax=Kribbella sp. NPDC051718 TaxID=3155168 RepID=UPI0034316A65
MTRPTSRVLALLELLQGGGTRRVGELAERLGVDERTVRRYAEHLVELDIPVRSVRGRYGGYRLAPGYRMPPLMLTDDEAVAVAIGLVVGRRAGLVPESHASESALAKMRRVLPARLADRLGALLATSSFTAPPRSTIAVDTDILLTVAEAARDRRGVEISYVDRRGRSSIRTIAPDGVVGHAGHWYVATADRTFRLDRISAASLLEATTIGSAVVDPASAVLQSLATAPWAHKVSVRVQGSVDDIQRHLPLGLALLTPLDANASDAGPAAGSGDGGSGGVRVEFWAERLDWVPALLAGLDLAFVIEEPVELRQRVAELGARLGEWAGG